MSYHYSAYGLRLRSNVPIPGFAPRRDTRYEVDIVFENRPAREQLCKRGTDQPWYTSAATDEAGRPILEVRRMTGEYGYHFLYHDGAEFLIGRCGSEVVVQWPSQQSHADLCTYLAGPVLGSALRLRGVTCLHASVVAIGENAVALIGPKGAGKSTTAAALCVQGIPVLSEDIAAVFERDGGFFVHPGYPRVNLWPDSVSALFGSATALPSIAPPWEKRYLPLNGAGARFADRALPLSRMYLLEERTRDPRAPFIEHFSSREQMISLLQNTYMSCLSEADQRGRDFRFLARLTEKIPVSRLTPLAGDVRRLCGVIVSNTEAIQ